MFALTVTRPDWVTGTKMSPGGISSPYRATGCRGDMVMMVWVLPIRLRIGNQEMQVKTDRPNGNVLGAVEDGEGCLRRQ